MTTEILNPGMQTILELDRVIHEPARLVILTVCNSAEEVEFKFLEATTGLSKGNLSSHISKLEQVGYVEVIKAFRKKIPVTSFKITKAGREALAVYWNALRGSIPNEV
jgi:DNA-binding MarR family transcriptional regulator